MKTCWFFVLALRLCWHSQQSEQIPEKFAINCSINQYATTCRIDPIKTVHINIYVEKCAFKKSSTVETCCCVEQVLNLHNRPTSRNGVIVLVLWSKITQYVRERVSLFIFYNACIDWWMSTESCVWLICGQLEIVSCAYLYYRTRNR